MIVKNNKLNVIGIADIVTLIPGVNEVDPKDWDRCGKIEHVKYLVKNRDLTIQADISAKDLSKISVDAAVELVKETGSRAVLTEMRSAEKRAHVIAAIEAQLEAVKPPPPAQQE